ncbi:acyl-CoA N-acyltransferase [Nemania sp. NC0429]|nr:acyl-CoA N-acyltransferase [Nemania sp. NC0429]
MSLPSHTNGQSSIRNFFRPKQPTYAPPPSASKKNHKPSTVIPSPAAAAATTPTTSPPPPPPPPPQQTTTTTATTTATKRTSSPSSSTRSLDLHPQASISRVRPEHIPALRRISSLLLPVNYPDSFYARLSDPLSSGAFSRVVLWRDDDNKKSPAKVVGGLVCRPEPSPFHAGTVDAPSRPRGPVLPSAQPNALYIQSLVLLSPYRGLGLAAALLDEVVADAARSEFACESVWAHVWTQNEEGLRWYTARGFACVDELKRYYKQLRPDSAWIVRRKIGPAAAMPGFDGSSSSPASGAGAAREADKAGNRTSVTAAAANLPITMPGGSPPPSLLPSSSSSSSPGLTLPPSSQTLPKPSSLPASTTATPPPPATRPPPNPLPNSSQSTPGQSFQNMRPETEWNDLPADMHRTGSGNNLSVPGAAGTVGTRSGASSRSSSSARKKRDRAYPAAAFGNGN